MGILDALNSLNSPDSLNSPQTGPENIFQSAKVARVDRVVPGRLVYVDTHPEAPVEASTCAFPLDKLIIMESNGVFHPYRGEPLSELGLKPGRRVKLVEMKDTKQSGVFFDTAESGPWLVIDPNPGIRHVASNTAQKVTETFVHIKDATLNIFKS